MAVNYPFWKKILCYISCEWFTKPIFGKRLCVCVYDIFGIKKKIKRKYKGKDGGLKFLRAPKIISLIGLDGSGKTTQAKKICIYLKKKNFKIRYIHTTKKSLLSDTYILISKNNTRKASSYPRLLRICVFLLGIPYLYLFKIIPSLLRQEIIICDRWFYDELIHIKYLYKKIPKLLYFIPKPSQIFFLDVSPETAFKRKPEKKKDYFYKKQKLYQELIKELRLDIIKVKSISSTWKQIKNKLDNYFYYLS